MKAITLRKIPPELAKAIHRKAAGDKTSATRAVVHVLEESLGLAKKKQVVHHDLDSLAGAWTKEEASVFEKGLRTQRRIDPELWK
jgi:hypothetical protein